MVTDMLSRRAAAEKPPLSTTCPNTVRLVSRSSAIVDYPLPLEGPFQDTPIIKSGKPAHPCRRAQAVWRLRGDAMTTKSVPKSQPSRRLVKRGALVALVVGAVAAGARYGYAYLTTGRYLQSTDDAYVRADYTIVAPKVSGYVADVL